MRTASVSNTDTRNRIPVDTFRHRLACPERTDPNQPPELFSIDLSTVATEVNMLFPILSDTEVLTKTGIMLELCGVQNPYRGSLWPVLAFSDLDSASWDSLSPEIRTIDSYHSFRR